MKNKQVIIVRKDLNMRKGKMCAQVAHASMGVFFDRIEDSNDSSLDAHNIKLIHLTKEMRDWMDGQFTKIVVGVESEVKLLELYTKARMLDLPCSLIKDVGKTEFNGVPTHTCVAIGPDKCEKVDLITNNLKLL